MRRGFVRDAEYRRGIRDSCVDGTRSAVLSEILLWAKDFDKSSVYWLHGLIGTGKSTITQTIVATMVTNGQLVASFFCSPKDEDQRDPERIFSTLAFQLARNHAVFRGQVYHFMYNPLMRVENSIADVLEKFDVSTVIVIDGLDKLEDKQLQ